jgi:hypothetical protein
MSKSPRAFLGGGFYVGEEKILYSVNDFIY